jgi:protein translocase SecG subunit
VFMLNFIELLIAVSIIILIVPQTPTENIVLRKLLETGFFTNYNKAKEFLIRITWVLIFLFLILLIALNLKAEF